MPDMIPAANIAKAALRQVQDAADSFPSSYHDVEKSARAKVHLEVAAELLALIVGPDQKFLVGADGSVKQVPTGGTSNGGVGIIASAPTSPPPPKPHG